MESQRISPLLLFHLFHQPRFLLPHFPGLGSAVDVVVSEEVEEAVGEEAGEFGVEGVAEFAGLAVGGFEGDGDVA